MASTFVEIALEDMERFLMRAYRPLRPRKGDSRGEVYFDLNLSDRKILIRVWTSIQPRSGMGAEKGADAIRVTMITGGGKALMPKGKIVKRTKNWRNALQDRIEELLEVYESKADYWKNRRSERDGEVAKAPGDDRQDHGVAPRAPEPVVEPKPPTSSGDMFEGGYRKLRNGDWGVQIYGRASEGDIVMAVTKGNKRTRVRLVRQDFAGPDKYKNNQYSEIWSFEELSGGKRFAGEEDDSTRSIVVNVASRFLQQV